MSDKSEYQRAADRERIAAKRRLGASPRGRKYLRGGAGPLNAPRVDVRPRATPIVPSWLCSCDTWNAPQRSACTECGEPKPEDAA